MLRETIDYINKEDITVKEINEFVEFYKQLLLDKKKLPNEVEFIFSNKLLVIDELFYSYLLLFKQDFPQIKILLNLPQNNITNNAFQLAKQHIVFLNTYQREKFISIKGEAHLELRNVKSNEFIPHILIKDSFWDKEKSRLSMFIDKEEGEITNKLKDIVLKNKDLFLSESIFLKREVFRKKLKEQFTINRISDISWHYIIDTLSELWVLRYLIVDSISKDNIKASEYRIPNLSQEVSNRLINKTIHTLISHGFFSFSTMKLFIFALLVKNSNFFIIHKTKDEYKLRQDKFIDEYQRHLKHLLSQTNDICYGLEELAKNIIEHSGKINKKGFGVISARIHSSDKVTTLKNSGEVFNKWFNKHKELKYNYLDINVIDSGLESVTIKYKSNLHSEIYRYSQSKKEPYNTLKKELENDLKKIEEEKYSFSRFLNFQKIELQHQIHRANARLGLLIFSNLVLEKKGGIIKISSTDLINNNTEQAYLFLNEKNFQEENIDNHNSYIKLGTNYNFIIPVELNEENIIDLATDEYKGTATSTLKTLFSYEIVDFNNLANYKELKKTYIIKNLPLPEHTDKYEKIYAFSKTIIEAYRIQKNSILLIDAQTAKDVISNASDWVRLLACIQFSNDIPLLVFNIDLKVHQEIIAINKIYDSVKAFWNDITYILFYIKYKYTYVHRRKINGKYQELSLWFCDVLNGRSFNNYLSLNNSISRYHYNLYSIIDHEIELKDDLPDLKTSKSKLFSKDGKLLNFELLLKLNNDLTIYEESVQSLLNIEVTTLPDKNLLKESIEKKELFFYKFKGYKVSDSHFKLGSKIHISDFYYAKRIFYNSFFANRFAFLVAKYVISNLLVGVKKNENISLIGYSRYSELLVSNVRRLLEEQGYKEINHDIILENNRVLKNASKINEKVIVIIPISSTFSTSDKIKKRLDIILRKHGYKKHESVGNTDINILLVANKDFENFKKNINLYDEFGWEKWTNDDFKSKILEKKESDNVNINYQKYFISLTTEWQAIHDCRLCFPSKSKGENEKCLIETGASSVSPESIFGFPITRPKIINKALTFRNYISDNNKPYVLQRHIKRDDKHYKQYIRAGSFLSKNKPDVISWLNELYKKNIFDNNDNVVIITPSRTANSGFVNMVNEYLLSETATVLQYSSTDDILQNFISFNSNFFYNSKILFVDDVMHTANSFHLINDYIKSIPFSNGRHKTIDHCFCIINRLGYFDEQNVLNSLSYKENQKGHIFSFVELDIPSIKQPNYEFPDITKGCLFNELANSSVMDMMKLHFRELSENIKAFDVDHNSKEPNSEISHLFNFLVYKALYSFFAGNFKKSTEFDYLNSWIDLFTYSNKEEILKILLNHVNKDRDVNSFLKDEIGSKFKFEVETRIIFICSTPPFCYYKDIKESAFNWIESKIEFIREEIIKNESNKQFFNDFFKCKKYDEIIKSEIPVEYCDYQTFKLYLRLAVELKSNYIFSIEMLNAIRILLNQLSSDTYRYSYEKKYSRNEILVGQTEIFDLTRNEFTLKEKKEKEISPIGFITYYTGLVQQLIYKEEAKATKLIKNIVEFIKVVKIDSDDARNHLTLRNDFNNHFVNLLRILVLENTFIFDTFQKTFQEEKPELKLYTLEKECLESNFNLFIQELKNYKGQASRFKALNKMLIKYNIKDNSVLDDDNLEIAFHKTIYLKTLLKNEIENKHNGGNIQQKVRIILKYLCEILDVKDEKCNGGAFFTMRYKNLNKNEENIVSDDLYSICNYAITDEDNIKANVTSNNSLVYELYRGIKEKGSKKPDSILELLYNDKKMKYDSLQIENYITEEELDVNGGYTETVHDQNYNNIFLLRVSDIKEDDSHFKIIDKLVESLNKVGFNKENFKIELKNVNKELRELIWKQINEVIEGEKLKEESISKDNIIKLKEILLEKKDRITFKTNPTAVLCFYKCNLKKKDTCPCREEVFCNFNGSNKRFDPKRLRFILLLRDDIRDFINYHLTNDSFRAFVEKEQRGEYMFSLSHGVETYEHMIGTLTEKLNTCSDTLLVRELETAIYYLTNKLHLVSNATKLMSGEFDRKDILYKYSLVDFINNLNSNYEMILTFNNEIYPKADLKSINFLNSIDSSLNNIEFYYPQSLIKEIAFEIIYNIRKNVIGRVNNISPENKLIIKLKLKELNDITYLGVSNNHSLIKQSSVARLNDKFRSTTMGVNGLNLIYNCLSFIFGKDNLHASIEESAQSDDRFFNIWIPLKNNNNVN